MNKAEYQKSMCVGCGLCHSLYNTEFDYGANGFLIPRITDSDVENHKKICPMDLYTSDEFTSPWGECFGVYEGWSKDNYIRKAASSGGVITSLAIFMLEKGYADGVIQVGESKHDHQKTQVRTSKNREQVVGNIGSRYSISSPLYDILERIEEGKKYVFIGKPCDVAALKQGMKINKVLQDSIVLTISFFCAGLPSDVANKKLLNEMGAAGKELISFRYRGNGWPGMAFAADSDGNEYSMEYAKAWGGILGREVNRICRYCIDGIGLYADIVCADLWYLTNEYKPDFSEHDGRNIVFARNAIGDETLKAASKNGYIFLGPYDDLDSLRYQQEHQFTRRTTMKYRIMPVKLFGKMAPKYSRKSLAIGSKYATKEASIKAFYGSFKRVIKGRV